MKDVDEILNDMADTFSLRSAVYGDNWRRIGGVMAAMYPDGLVLKTAEDWNRHHLFLLMMVKMTRLAVTNLDHADSAHDTAVYSAMLQSLIEGGRP